jgi:DNA invertase Pin-like site-specific DNA recombinase
MSVIAAVYARKSTDQLGLTDEQKSVTRQVEHARAYAVRKGWTVPDECVFMDDAVSVTAWPIGERCCGARSPRRARSSGT